MLMRLICGLLLALCLSGQILMPIVGNQVHGTAETAPSFVQSASDAEFNTSATASFGSNITAGSAIVAAVYWNSTSVAPTAATICGTTVTPFGTTTVPGDGQMALLSRANASAGACSVVVTFAANHGITLMTHEVSGANTSTPVDVSIVNPQTSGNSGTNGVTSTALTTTHVDYCFGASVTTFNGGGVSAGTGFTSRVSGASYASEDKRQTVVGSQAMTFTNAGADHNATAMIGVRP